MRLDKADQTFEEYGIHPFGTIHVYQKNHDIKYNSDQVTSEQIQKAVSCYRKMLKDLANGPINVSRICLVFERNLAVVV